MHQALDAFGRPLRSIRISVTDRCNLRCAYCMPEEHYVWLDRGELLSFEEITELTRIFVSLGVNKLRLTGGEPLLRRDLAKLIRMLAAVEGVRDLALTTNGVLLERYATSLRQARLQRVTISLDTLRPERFRALTSRESHARVVEGIQAAHDAGFDKIKINTVLVRGFNEDELAEMIEFGKRVGAEVRFIEYMDVGGAVKWSMDQVVSRSEMLRILESRFGQIPPLENTDAAPADRYRLPDGTTFGIISSVTQPFCGNCDRARLTADGVFFLCLYAREGTDLKRLLRGGASREEIGAAVAALWGGRADRGAEDRLDLAARSILFPVEELRKDPHREMHTRGG